MDEVAYAVSQAVVLVPPVLAGLKPLWPDAALASPDQHSVDLRLVDRDAVMLRHLDPAAEFNQVFFTLCV